ncbi:hypothetical protein NC653_035420 [Populus alba x Populus x berolinensis]|uniref:Uncharacterized protein n=1 Tax=Populus alba x Populus x berolinensis TaxID=444605 RepID=A0AAD6PXB0_9ROSI|nr:hypothetical protein NC653_035420 [Populus alba x Populus x berolinensis]
MECGQLVWWLCSVLIKLVVFVV